MAVWGEAASAGQMCDEADRCVPSAYPVPGVHCGVPASHEIFVKSKS